MTMRNFGVPFPQQGQRVAARLTAAPGVTLTGVTNANQTLVWAINPKSLSDQKPARVTTVNTLTGAYQDNWGRGIGKLQLSGNTGWMKKEQNGLDGFEFCQALQQLHDDYLALVEQNNPELVFLTLLLPPGALGTIDAATAAAVSLALSQGLNQLLGFGQAGQGQAPARPKQFAYYRISSDNLEIDRDTSSPLLFNYTWQLTILQDLLEAQTIDPSAQFVLTSGATGGTDGTPGVTPTGGDNGNGDPLGVPTGSAGDQGSTSVSPPTQTPAAQSKLVQTISSALALQQAAGADPQDLLVSNTYSGVVTAQQVAAQYGVSTTMAQAFTKALNGVTLPTGAAGSPTTLIGPGNVLIGTSTLLARDGGLL